MANMNKSKSITGRPRQRATNAHAAAIQAAYASGLAEWALANGFVCPDGTPMIHSSKQRRVVERARAAKQD